MVYIDDKLKEACRLFAEKYGVAVLEDEEDTSIIRWLGAGALTEEQKQGLTKIYNELGE